MAGWWGKLLGGTVGFFAGGPIGAALGTAVGHSLDKGVELLHRASGLAAHERVQAAFFNTTFTVMGYVAKADGRVSEQEIAFAQMVMEHMALDAQQRRTAANLFRDGKRSDFPLDSVVNQFKAACQGRRNVLRMFLEIQLQAAYADGEMEPRERELIVGLFERLGFSRNDLAQMESTVRAARHFSGWGRNAGARRAPTVQKELIRNAYQVLGVEPGVDDGAIKQAYRRLMNQHHPDKLVAKGLPEEMVRLATQKTQEIKDAYATIKKARGFA